MVYRDGVFNPSLHYPMAPSPIQFQPIGENVLVLPVTEKISALIHLPDQAAPNKGVVAALGKGGVEIAKYFKKGDVIQFREHSGEDVEVRDAKGKKTAYKTIPLDAIVGLYI